jgi:hypothetical protein
MHRAFVTVSLLVIFINLIIFLSQPCLRAHQARAVQTPNALGAALIPIAVSLYVCQRRWVLVIAEVVCEIRVRQKASVHIRPARQD